MTRYYVTKYALSTGKIAEVDVPEVEYNTHPPVPARHEDTLYYGSGEFRVQVGLKDFFLTREEAVTRAEELRFAKIVSLKRQMDKLKQLRFKD